MSTYSNTNRPAAPVMLELPGMSLHGFTGTLILTGDSGAELVGILKSMAAAGMVQAAPAPAPVAPVAASASSGPPTCPTHQRPMKESRKPGTYYCSAKVGDGYCDHKVKA